MLASLNPKAFREEVGLPHPLSKFSADGAVKEGPYADGILAFVNDLSWETPESTKQSGDVVPIRERESILRCMRGGGDRRGEAKESLGILWQKRNRGGNGRCAGRGVDSPHQAREVC
jgi:hypothetical protein